MKIQRNILILSALTLGLFCPYVLRAQSYINSWTQSSPSVIFGIDTNGTLLSTGPITNTASFNSDENAAIVQNHSSELLWVPSLGAMRVGLFFSAPGTSNMGSGSFAFGQFNVASGPYSFATGATTTASGGGAIAMGISSMASGSCSFAAGNSSVATGYDSFAAGVAFASGSGSVALGSYVTASGDYSASFNVYTTAPSLESTTFGSYNVGLNEAGGAPSATAWVSSDPLFEIGNSRTAAIKTDALVIFKDGSSIFQGPITASAGVLTTAASVAGTDIPMYSGN